MLPVFADPKTYVVFKRIFGAEARKPLLIALLNDLLELKGPRRIRDVQHLSLEQHVTVPKSKLSIVDVKCTTASGRRFVVEMQVLPVEGFEKRVVYNASKAYVMQLRDADDYPKLCDVVGVTICNFMLWPKELKGHRYERSKMAEQDERGAISLAHREGRTEEAARAVLTALRVRGIVVPDAARERILAQKDPARLERWLERAIVASSVAEVIDEAS